MSGITAGPYAAHRDTVAELMRAGEPFGQVESAIEGTELEADAKSALWLLAFSLRNSPERRRDAHADRASLR
jgi:hypothetical protein